MELLEELKVPSDAKQWKSFKSAIKSARKRGIVNEIETRLFKIQRQINYRLNLMMTYVPVDLLDWTNSFAPVISNLRSLYE